MKKQTPEQSDEQPTANEPEPFTPEWFDNAIAHQKQLAQQAYDEWRQLQGAVASLIQMKAFATKDDANGDDPTE